MYNYMLIRARAHTKQARIHQVVITLASIRGLNCNSDSVHQFFRPSPSPLALFLIEIQIFPS